MKPDRILQKFLDIFKMRNWAGKRILPWKMAFETFMDGAFKGIK